MGENDQALVDLMAQNAAEVIDWLTERARPAVLGRDEF